MLVDWLSRPHVVEWWGGEDAKLSIEGARQKYLPRMNDGSSVKCYVAQLDGEAIGYIQSYQALGEGDGWWEEEADPGVHGIDQFLADGRKLGQGLGTRMVSAFVRKLLADRAVTKVQTDPDPANTRAIRCYAKAGFLAVREITTPDGPALLMEVTRGRLPQGTGAA